MTMLMAMTKDVAINIIVDVDDNDDNNKGPLTTDIKPFVRCKTLPRWI